MEATNFLPTQSGTTNFSEGDPGFQAIDLGLLTGLNTDGTDRDGDTITFSNAVLLNESGETVINDSVLEGDIFQFDRTAFQFLNQGETRSFTLQTDVFDGTATRTITTTINLTGTEDAPVAGEPLELTFSDDDDVFDLTELVLGNVTDADAGDDALLTIVAIGGGNTSTPPDGAELDGGTLTFDPTAYQDLNAGEQQTVVIAVRVDDDFVTSPSNTTAIQLVEITIVGNDPDNAAPTVSGPVTGTFSEDDPGTSGQQVFDLLTGASDADDDALAVANLVVSYSGSGALDFMLGDGERFLSIAAQQAAFQSIPVNESETITLTYDVVDGRGGSVAQTASFTVTGLNDNPDAGGDLVFVVSESDAEFSIDGLGGQPGVAAASDVDEGDTLSFDGYNLLSGDDRGFFSSLDFIGVDPSAYSDLNEGETETVVIEIEVDDGNGGSDTRTATITIEGEGAPPNPPGNFTDGVTIFQFSAVEGGESLQAVLTDSVTTPEGGPVTLTTFVSPVFDGLTYDAGTRTFLFDPTDAAYDGLRAGERLSLLTVAEATDGNGGFTDVEIQLEIVGVNDDPTVAAPLTLDTQEDFSLDFLNLLDGAQDADEGDVLFISNISGIEGFEDAFQIDPLSGSLNVETIAFSLDFIAEGEVETFVINYDITDAYGGTVAQTATINVTGSNDGPTNESGFDITVQADIEGLVDNDDNLRREIDLFATIFDPENDDFSIVEFSVTSADDEAYSVDTETGLLTIDYNAFAATDFGEFSINYTVEDENGAQSFFFGSISVIELVDNDAPVSSGLLTADISPVNSDDPVDLFANITDENGDALVVERVIGLDESFFDFDTGEFLGGFFADGLAEGESFDLVFTVVVGDGAGGSVEQDVEITFTGQNDAPSATALNTSFTFTEDDGIVLIDLLNGIEDANGDALSVSISEGTIVGERYLRIDTSAFSSLTQGESDLTEYTVTVDDGNGGVENYVLDVTVDGVDDLPEIIREARFFDNDVEFYQFSGGQQNFVIRANELFDDGDDSGGFGIEGDRFTSVSVQDGPSVGVSISSDGEIVIDPSSFTDLLDTGERVDVVFAWQGVTEDGNEISGTFDYRVEGTSATTDLAQFTATTMTVVTGGPYVSRVEWFMPDFDEGPHSILSRLSSQILDLEDIDWDETVDFGDLQSGPVESDDALDFGSSEPGDAQSWSAPTFRLDRNVRFDRDFDDFDLDAGRVAEAEDQLSDAEHWRGVRLEPLAVFEPDLIVFEDADLLV